MGTLSQKTNCPVCGWDLGFPAWQADSACDEICPCCGIQFGYDDFAAGDIKDRATVHQEWRERWKQRGMPWSSLGRTPPVGWDPVRQLHGIGV
jgi:hypothetical protein